MNVVRLSLWKTIQLNSQIEFLLSLGGLMAVKLGRVCRVRAACDGVKWNLPSHSLRWQVTHTSWKYIIVERFSVCWQESRGEIYELVWSKNRLVEGEMILQDDFEAGCWQFGLTAVLAAWINKLNYQLKWMSVRYIHGLMVQLYCDFIWSLTEDGELKIDQVCF